MEESMNEEQLSQMELVDTHNHFYYYGPSKFECREPGSPVKNHKKKELCNLCYCL